MIDCLLVLVRFGTSFVAPVCQNLFTFVYTCCCCCLLAQMAVANPDVEKATANLAEVEDPIDLEPELNEKSAKKKRKKKKPSAVPSGDESE